jgi:hypothetical protein
MTTEETFKEALSLALKFIQKSQEGRVVWQEFPLGDGESYRTELGPYSFVVSRSRGVYGFVMKEKGLNGKSITEVAVDSDADYGYLNNAESSLSHKLPILFDLARRAALEVDKKIADADNLLDEL